MYVYIDTVSVSWGFFREWEGGGEACQHDSHISFYRLSAVASSEPVSVEVWRSYCFVSRGGQRGSLCHPFPWYKKKILQREMCSAGCSWCQGIASVLGFISAFSGCLYIVLIGCILWFYLPPGMRLSRNVGQCVLVWCACCRAEARLVRPLPVCGWSSQQGTTRKSVLSFYVLKVLIM